MWELRAAGLPSPNAGPLQEHWWGPPGVSPPAPFECGLSLPPGGKRGGSQKGRTARELAWPWSRVYSQQQGSSNPQEEYQIQTI